MRKRASYRDYWEQRYLRIKALLAVSHRLESLVVYRSVHHSSSGGLPYRVENGHLAYHSYNKKETPKEVGGE